MPMPHSLTEPPAPDGSRRVRPRLSSGLFLNNRAASTREASAAARFASSESTCGLACSANVMAAAIVMGAWASGLCAAAVKPVMLSAVANATCMNRINSSFATTPETTPSMTPLRKPVGSRPHRIHGVSVGVKVGVPPDSAEKDDWRYPTVDGIGEELAVRMSSGSAKRGTSFVTQYDSSWSAESPRRSGGAHPIWSIKCLYWRREVPRQW